MLSICLIAQTAIFLKKKFELRRDRFAVGNIKYEEKKNNTNCMNIQKWNPAICNTPQYISLIFVVVFVINFASGNLLLKWSNLNSNEKSLMATNIFQLILNLGIPLALYAKNKSIFQHLIHEILGEFFGIENVPTNFPKFPSMIFRSTPQKMKMISLQKLQSKSEPASLGTSASQHNDTCTTKKMTNEIVQCQDQEETFDKVDEEPNHIYPKRLSYCDQKVLLSAARLKNAGFQLSNSTPEDGNCLIHALKDQMR